MSLNVLKCPGPVRIPLRQSRLSAGALRSSLRGKCEIPFATRTKDGGRNADLQARTPLQYRVFSLGGNKNRQRRVVDIRRRWDRYSSASPRCSRLFATRSLGDERSPPSRNPFVATPSAELRPQASRPRKHLMDSAERLQARQTRTSIKAVLTRWCLPPRLNFSALCRKRKIIIAFKQKAMITK